MQTKHLTITWLFLAGVAVAISTAAAPPASSPAPPVALCLPCRVVKVHDGDTATDVVIEVHVQVRYADCWAPELSQPGGKESHESAKSAEGKSGRLFIPIGNAKSLSDLFTFGRVVGTIWPDGATESESARQVRLKMASTTKGGTRGE